MIDIEIDPCAEHESLARATPASPFALCRNVATTVRPHSLLGGVPICARCDAKVARLEGETVRTCRVCGCTDERACEGGCAWVGADLCSRCAGLGYIPGEVPDAVEG